jgi:hypothetical protein
MLFLVQTTLGTFKPLCRLYACRSRIGPFLEGASWAPSLHRAKCAWKRRARMRSASDANRAGSDSRHWAALLCGHQGAQYRPDISTNWKEGNTIFTPSCLMVNTAPISSVISNTGMHEKSETLMECSSERFFLSLSREGKIGSTS